METELRPRGEPRHDRAAPPLQLRARIGHEIEEYEWDGLRLPGWVMDLTEAKSSEHNLRNLYRRWAQFMESESWAELATWRNSAAPQTADGGC